MKDDLIMLISERVLDCIAYQDAFVIIPWEQSGLRAWLTGAFLHTAFDGEELAALSPAPVDPKQISRFGGDDPLADDLVTTIGYMNLNDYFASKEDMAARATAYAQAQGLELNEDGLCNWWLRMDGYSSDDAAVVDGSNGGGKYVPVNEQGIGVRPVIWVDLQTLVQ